MALEGVGLPEHLLKTDPRRIIRFTIRVCCGSGCIVLQTVYNAFFSRSLASEAALKTPCSIQQFARLLKAKWLYHFLARALFCDKKNHIQSLRRNCKCRFLIVNRTAHETKAEFGRRKSTTHSEWK